MLRTALTKDPSTRVHSACVPWLVVVCPARRRMHASIGARAPWLVVLSIVPLPALLFWSSRGTLHQAVCHTRVAGRGEKGQGGL